MTDTIDLDEIDTGDDEAETDEGDWFWGDGDPPEESANAGDTNTANVSPDVNASDEDSDSGGGTDASADVESEGGDGEVDGDADRADRIPHVPHQNKNQPAGIPVEQGGSGAGAAHGSGERAQAPEDKGEMQASGPHGGDADDMTTAFTLNALDRIENIQKALADTNQWSDWIGIVGDVESHTIQKFQRDHGLDVDFFNGTGSGPAKRLAEIDPTSMFYAKRMVVVGVEGEEWFAEDDDWEFVPVEEAADGADWNLAE